MPPWSGDWISISESLEIVPAREDIDLTVVGQGISVTSENQIVLELMPEDIVPANPLDLAGRTLLFTPDGDGYSRELRALDWDDDLGDPVDNNTEIVFSFDFAGRQWESFFVSRYGLITFGEPYPFSQHGPDRWGTMAEIAKHLGAPPMIAALYKPRLGGWSVYDAEERFRNRQHVSRRPDQVVVTWVTSDPAFHVHGVPPQEKTRFQMALHADGRIALHYAPEPNDPDEAIRDGIVGLFPGAVETGLLGSIADPEDGSLPGHLDLVETAVYTTTEANVVLVEFTTRAPIRPLPGQELIYSVAFDVDEPFTEERDDRDLMAAVAVLPDGGRVALWDAARAAFGAHENRIGLLVDLHAIGARAASVSGRSGTTNSITGAWSQGDSGRSDVVMFPEVAASAPTDLSEPGSSASAREAFRHTGVKDHLVPIGCRVIETLGDGFDALVFHSQFRYDLQFSGSWWGYYPGNAPIRGIGFHESLDERKSPCGTRLRGQWGFPVQTKSDFVAVMDGSGRLTPSPEGTWHFAHEFTHTWTASASYLRDGEIEPLADGSSHWLPGLHTPSAFARTGSIMGGDFWRENPDGTFTRLLTEGKAGEGLSWLDLYLAGLATEDEVPDTFLLRNLRETGAGWRGPHSAEKEIVTMEQILAALGPRDPPAARSQKVFNVGFVYLLEPGQVPDQDQLRLHARFLEAALQHWARITGGRGRLTTELPTRRAVPAKPPFQGTVWLSPDTITTADPSGLTGITYTGRGRRTIWDYRVLDWITVNAYLFEARIRGRSIEFQCNPEFGSIDAARAEVDTYATAIGRLPAILLSRVERVHLNAGDPEHPDAAQRRSGRVTSKVFGGNYSDRSFTIHTGYGRRMLRLGFLEEALFHEGAHVSLQNHQEAAGWRRAQEADGKFISDYASDHPDREDVAESVLAYFALRYRPDRLAASHRAAIADTIPNRLEYFDGLALDWSPYTLPEDQVYYFPHLAVGAGWQTTLTYINYSSEQVSCRTDFLSDHGSPLMVSFAEQGTVDSRTDVLPPGGSVHEETNVALSTPLAPGWARATCSGPVKASLLFRRYTSAGVPAGEAAVNAATVPATRFVTFAEQGEGKAGTGVAYANPSATAARVTFTVRDATGRMLASSDQSVPPGGHGAQNMAGLFDLPSFGGSLEVTSTEPIVTLSLNFEADPVFSSLPPGELDAAAHGATNYYFPHLAVGAGWQTTLTYINYSSEQVSCRTDFLSDHGSPLMVSFAEQGTVDSRTDVLPPGGSVHEETNVALSTPLAPGWARATCSGPVKASLLFRRYTSAGVPAGEAAVNAATVPATRFVTFAEQGEGKAGTGVAYANPSATAARVTFTVRDATGRMLASSDQSVPPGGHGAQNMAGLFDLPSFGGSLEVTSTEPIVTLSLNFEADPTFSSLPPGEVEVSGR